MQRDRCNAPRLLPAPRPAPLSSPPFLISHHRSRTAAAPCASCGEASGPSPPHHPGELPSPDAVTIGVVLLNGSKLIVDVMGTDTVDAVMARVFSLAGEVVTPAVYLAHNGTKLEGARTIADYKIAMGATLVAQTVAGLTINFFVASGRRRQRARRGGEARQRQPARRRDGEGADHLGQGHMAASAGLEEGVPSENVAPSLSLLERLRMMVPAAQTEENHWLMGAAIFPKDGSAPAYAPEVQDEINAAMEKVACTLQEMEDAAALPGGEASAEGTHVEPPKHAYRVDDSSKTFPEGRVRLYCKATATAKPLARGTGGGSSGTAGTGGDLEEPAVAVVPTTGGGAPPTTAKASPPPPPTFNLAGVGPAALEKKTSPYYCDLANWCAGATRRTRRRPSGRAAAARSTAARSPPPASRRRPRRRPRRR